MPTDSRALVTFESPEIGKFEFVKLAALRAAQLMRGCRPRVAASGKCARTAQREVADGKVSGLPRVLHANHVAP